MKTHCRTTTARLGTGLAICILAGSQVILMLQVWGPYTEKPTDSPACWKDGKTNSWGTSANAGSRPQPQTSQVRRQPETLVHAPVVRLSPAMLAFTPTVYLLPQKKVKGYCLHRSSEAQLELPCAISPCYSREVPILSIPAPWCL